MYNLDFFLFFKKWPFVDVIFYDENSTHIWEVDNFKYMAPKEYIFPLRLRPFGTLMLPTPYNPAGYFNASQYNNINEKCTRSSWSHQNESGQRFIEMNCYLLKEYYPFVDRVCDDEKCEESLRIGETILQKFISKKSHEIS